MPGVTPLLIAALAAIAPNPRLPAAPEDGGPPLSVEDPHPRARAAVVVAAPTPEPPAAKARLQGQIMVLGSRDALPGARVITEDGEALAADLEGRFTLWLPPGEHTLVLRAPGYDDLEVSVTLEPGEDAVYEYRMGAAAEGNPYKTTVRQEREVAVSSTNLRDDEIHALPGSAGDPFRVVKSLPGVAQLAGFLPYVIVRGAAPGNTGYYLDGIRVPILFHVAVGPSIIHPYFIDSVDFYPSGAPARLGRFASGIIEGRTRPARRDRVRGDFDVRLTDAGGILEVPINRPREPGCKARRKKDCPKGQARGSLTVAGRYSYTSALLTLLQSAARIQFWDYQARFDHRITDDVDYTAFAYGSFDEIGQKGDEESFLRFEFYRLQQRVRQRLARDGEANYSLGLGYERTGVADVKSGEWRIAPRVDIRRPIGERGDTELGFGLDQEFQIFRADLAEDLDDPGLTENLSYVLGNRFVSATGVYAELLWRKGNVELRPGLRGDLYVQLGRSPVLPDAQSVTYAVGVDPRLLVRERLNDRWTLRQNVGLYHQPPSLPVPLPGIESFGFDRGLQRNLQGSVGYEYKIGETFILTQDIYAGWLSNLQDYELARAIDGDVREVDDLVIQITGYAFGLETMIRLDPRLRAYGWAAYTLSRSMRDYQLGGTSPSSW
ncbi:MAG: TonB-dependent receptor, partial [Nannocystaceae bacterium]